MNHIKNIKEMLSISTGNSGQNNRNTLTSGCSSFTDSQIFFGSQFWPENSQTTSQDMSLSSRNSQQSSQEESGPKFLSNYLAKPPLFGELNVVQQFEEAKKRVKEKADSDMLVKECQSFRETLNNVHQLISGTEKNTAVCKTVAEKIDDFTSTMQMNLSSLQTDISHQFETLLNKVASQKEVLIDLEKRVQKHDSATENLCSNLQSLKNGLQCLKEEQMREQKMVEETLTLLSTLVSEHAAKPTSVRVMDNAIQTSPELEMPFYNNLHGKKLQSTLTSISNNLERNKPAAPHRDLRSIGSKKLTLKRHRRTKKRPLMPSGRRKHVVTDENRQPLMKAESTKDGLMQDNLKSKREVRSIATGCIMTPLSCWSQDSSSSACILEIEPVLEKLAAESRTATPLKTEGLWQLFDMDYD